MDPLAFILDTFPAPTLAAIAAWFIWQRLKKLDELPEKVDLIYLHLMKEAQDQEQCRVEMEDKVHAVDKKHGEHVLMYHPKPGHPRN